MSVNLDRLRQGERWWAAEAVLRGAGLLVLAACYHLGLVAQRLAVAPPLHRVTLPEFALSVAVFFLLTTGLALTVEGPGLFRQVAIPVRSAYFPRT